MILARSTMRSLLARSQSEGLRFPCAAVVRRYAERYRSRALKYSPGRCSVWVGWQARASSAHQASITYYDVVSVAMGLGCEARGELAAACLAAAAATATAAAAAAGAGVAVAAATVVVGR